MTRFLMAAAVAFAAGSTARAGGPPPVYVLVDEVVLSPPGDSPERITIRGSFVRQKEGREGGYGRPVAGSVTLGLDPASAKECRAEWKEWAKAAGAGKVVAVGLCEQAGAFLTVKIRAGGDPPAAPDATYTPGHLTAVEPAVGGKWSNEAPVKALVAFARERADARATRPARP